MENKSRIIGFVVLLLLMVSCIIFSISRIKDNQNAHYETATVVAIQRLDVQIVRFETADGNLWEEEFDLDEPIDIGDEAVLAFKDDNNSDRKDDIIINVFLEKE